MNKHILCDKTLLSHSLEFFLSVAGTDIYVQHSMIYETFITFCLCKMG